MYNTKHHLGAVPKLLKMNSALCYSQAALRENSGCSLCMPDFKISSRQYCFVVAFFFPEDPLSNSFPFIWLDETIIFFLLVHQYLYFSFSIKVFRLRAPSVCEHFGARAVFHSAFSAQEHIVFWAHSILNFK